MSFSVALLVYFHLQQIISFAGNICKMRVSPAFWLLVGLFVSNWSFGILSEGMPIQRHQISTLRPVVERVFSRKKRWMVFPKGSSLKFTVSVSKRLLAMYPKGFTFNLEAAIYYPMPAARIDLIPKRFRKPTTKAPPVPKGPTPLYLVGIPGSLIKYRAKPAIKPATVQRIDPNVSSLQRLPPQSFNLYKNNSQKWSKYSSPEYLKNYQWSAEKAEKYVNKYSSYDNINWSSQSPKLYSSVYRRWHRRPRYSREANRFEEPDFFTGDFESAALFDELETFEDSPHYQSYRDRRELFHHFEGLSKVLGIDVKSCILRAMCDSKRVLLPPGYSMIQDILRVVFTFPTIDGLKDEYSRIMDADYQTCDASTHSKCRFSILDWLLNSHKSI